MKKSRFPDSQIFDALNRADKGLGVPQNYEVAEKWYRLAALQGNVNASYRLADLHDSGENGVPKDLKKATEWFSFAAEHVNVDA